MSNKTKIDAIDDLLSSVDHDVQTVEILGKEVPLQPVTILQCVRLVKRFPGLIDLFEPKVDKETGKELPEHLQPSLISVVVASGSEAVSALVACAVSREGDRDFEFTFAQKPDKLTLPMFQESVRITVGEEGAGAFFTKLVTAMTGAGILQPKAAVPDSVAA